jgi:hypothetical protein
LENRIAPATFIVDDLSDDPALISNPKPGTLRWAVDRANRNDGADEITIIKMGMIPMSAPLPVSEAVNIDPFGATDLTIDFSKMTTPGPGFFVCGPGPTPDGTPVVLSGLTIKGMSGFPAIKAMDLDLTIQGCEITGNSNAGPGGAVYFGANSTNYPQLTIQNSTIAGNTSAGNGGGVYLKNRVLVVINNSTIANNVASGNGGGIAANTADLSIFTLRNSTVTGNTANGAAGGGGLYFSPSSPTPLVFSTIVSGDSNVSAPDIKANQVDLQFSAVGSPNGFVLSAVSGQNLPPGTNVMLGALGNNGGETRTFPLLPGSPAIDHGGNQFNTPYDQRGPGFARNVGPSPDIGAYETSPIPYAHSKRMDVFTSGGATFNVVVTYSDDLGINPATIDVNDISVTGPGFAAAKFPTTVSFMVAGATLTATYTFAAPGGTWIAADNGTYTVKMQPNQVFDIDPTPNAVPGTSAPTSSLGDFFVNIPVPIVVDEPTDINDGNISPGHLSLREAIIIANAQNARSATTITFDPTVFSSAKVITISPADGGELQITAPVTIIGPAAGLTLSGGNTNRIFNVNVPGYMSQPTPPTTESPSVIGSVFISGLTLANGKATTGDGGAVLIQNGIVNLNSCIINNSSAIQNGGGIATGGNGGSVTIVYSTISGNSAGLSGNGGGGGIFINGNGNLVIESSTLSGNTVVSMAGAGGGAYLSGSNPTNSVIVNSTVSGNAAPRGGGVALLNWQSGTLMVFNSTITNNNATTTPDGGGILIGGVGASVGTLTLSSTILAGNTASNGPDLEFLPPLASQNVGGDNNLVGVANVGNFALTGIGNLTGTLANPLNPGIGPLANNGGPTQTQALLAGSPAFNAGNNILCLDTDQRGFRFNTSQPYSIGSFGTNVIVGPPPTVTNLKIDDGTIQRSMIDSLTVTFSEAVTFTGAIANAFHLHRDSAPPPGPGAEQGGVTGNVNLTAAQVGSVVTLTFLTSGANPVNGVGGNGIFSLPDGRYTLTIDHTQVMGVGGNMASDYVLASAPAPAAPTNIFRFFGDVNGDGSVTAADQNGVGGANPIIGFRQAFGGPDHRFDYNGDGSVAASDFAQFRIRFGGLVP